MLRAILCGVVGVAIMAGCSKTSPTNGSSGDQPGRGRGSRAGGTIESVDSAAGTLTVNVRRRNADAEAKTYQVEDDTTITSYTGENKTELKGKTGLSDPQFKKGNQVRLTTSDDRKKALSIQVGDLPRRGRGGRGGRGNRGAQGPMQ